MLKTQERIEEIQYSMLEIINNVTLLCNSERKTAKEKVSLIKQYMYELYDEISEDIAIHNDEEDKIIELVQTPNCTSSNVSRS